MLRRGVVAPNVRAGDVLTFDSNVLHGATKPTKRRRVSFDFRLIPPSYVKGTNKKIQRLFNEVNRSVDMTNAQNLIVLGDFLGASRIYERMAAKTGNAELSRIAEVLGKRQADQEILQAHSQMKWQKEYFWLLDDSSGNS